MRPSWPEGIETPLHKSFKKISGTSTSMETDIMVEGFKSSMEIYNLKYLELVGDGDSSVYSNILQAKPYGNVMIECVNHLLRNFSRNYHSCSTKI